MERSKKTQIKAIIFDIGGVQYFYDHLKAAKKISKILNYSERKIYYMFEKEKSFIRFREKKKSEKEYWDYFAKKLNLKEIPIQKIKKPFNDIFTPNKKILDMLPKLEKNYKLGLISNLNKGHKDFLKSHFNVTKHFSVSIFSCDVDIRKPDPKIFRIALKRLNVMPKEAIFIDDFKSNIIGAKRIGIQGIRYENHNKFLKQLKELGVKI